MTVNAITHPIFPHLSNTQPVKADESAQVFNEWGIPRAWIEAELCTEEGHLRFISRLKVRDISLDALFNQWVEIGYHHVSMRTYFDALMQAFADTPCKLYLRGSYATFLLQPIQIFREILDDFNVQYPEAKPLIEAGWEALIPHLPPFVEPDDSDWALILDEKPSPMQLDEIRHRLVAINADLCKQTMEFAEEKTFRNLFIAQVNPLTQFADPIVIASLQGKTRLDLMIGQPNIAPYLFTCDNHYIRIGQMCTPEVDAQSIVDSCLGIVRAEERHALDFRALIKAVKHLSQGKKWDESKMAFRKIINGFLALPTHILTQAIQKKIDEKSVEPVSFVLNLLALVDNPARLQELWQALWQNVTNDPTLSFHQACSDAALYKERFPNAIGCMPRVDSDKEQGFLTCLDNGILKPDEETAQIFNKFFASYEGMQLINWLKKVGSKIKSTDKEWVIDLWIEMMKQERLPLLDFKLVVETLLNSRIPVDVKTRCFFKIWHAFGSQVFTQNAKPMATPLFAGAASEDLEDWLLELDDPKHFLEAHQARLEESCESLFKKANARDQGAALLHYFRNSPHYARIVKATLPSLPPGTRHKWIHAFPEASWENFADFLSTEENNQLQLEHLRRSKSFFVLCSLRRSKVPVPHTLEVAALNHLRQTLQGPEVDKGIEALVNALQIDALLEIFPKLSPAIREKTIQRLEERVQGLIATSDLEPLFQILQNRELCRYFPFNPAMLDKLKVPQELAQALLILIESQELDRSLFHALCLHYLPLQRSALEETRFQRALFQSFPHPLPAPLFAHLIRGVLADPEPMKELIAKNGNALMEQMPDDGAITCRFLEMLQKLKIALPQTIPLTLVRYLTEHLETEFSLAVCLLERKETAPLRFAILSILIEWGHLALFDTWLHSSLSVLSEREKVLLLDQIKSLPIWMEQLLLHLKKHLTKPLEPFLQIFLEKYLAIHGARTRETCASLGSLPIQNYAVLIPLLQNEEQVPHLLNWLDPKKANLPGITDLFAHLVQKALKEPTLGPILDCYELVVAFLNDQDLRTEVQKRALNTFLDEGKGSRLWVYSASTERELRQSIERLSAIETPIEDNLLQVVFRQLIKLSQAEPDLLWGEAMASQILNIIRTNSNVTQVKTRDLIIEFISNLVNETETLEHLTRVTLLYNFVKFAHSPRAAEAYQKLISIIQNTEHLELEILEAFAELTISSSQTPNSILLERLNKESYEHEPEERRLRYEMLKPLACFCAKTEGSEDSKPSIVNLMTTVCNTAYKLGNVDLSATPYNHFFGKSFPVLARLNAGAFSRLFRTLCFTQSRYREISEQAPFVDEFIPQFLTKCFKYVKIEDFDALLAALQILLTLAKESYPTSEGRDKLIINCISQVVAHPYFKGTEKQTEALIPYILVLSKATDRCLYSYFLVDLPDYCELTRSYMTQLNPEEATQMANIAINIGFQRNDLTGIHIISSALSRAISLKFTTEVERLVLYNHLIPQLKKIMPDKESAIAQFKTIVKCLPGNVSKQEKREVLEHLKTLESSWLTNSDPAKS